MGINTMTKIEDLLLCLREVREGKYEEIRFFHEIFHHGAIENRTDYSNFSEKQKALLDWVDSNGYST